MANIVAILGYTGSGKSRSIKNLDPENTIYLNTVGKPISFKGSRKLFNKERKNYAENFTYATLLSALNTINTSESMKHIKNVIIDDIIYMMRQEFFDRSQERGFDKYNIIAANFQSLLTTCRRMRPDINIFIMLHPEPVESDGSIVSHKVATVGKLIDKMSDPLELVTVTLFAKPKYDEEGRPVYGFYTNNILLNGVEIRGKSPEGMFDDIFIPNDLNYVANVMEDYYG